jgi:hypothetical protein
MVRAVKRTVSCETVSATSCIGVHSSGVPIQLEVLIAEVNTCSMEKLSLEGQKKRKKRKKSA